MSRRFPGATGKFPQGKMDDTDEGEIGIVITYDKLNGVVRIDFGKPVAWLGLPPQGATELAHLLLKCAEVGK